MIKYRPHRGSLSDAMKEARVFGNIDEMKLFVWDSWNRWMDWCGVKECGFFDLEDIVIGEVLGDDNRIGWKNVRHVCIKRFGDKDYMEIYGSPQCIGWCGE